VELAEGIEPPTL